MAMAPCVLVFCCIRCHGLLLCVFFLVECVGGWLADDGPIAQVIACSYSDVAVMIEVVAILKEIFMGIGIFLIISILF